MLNLNDVCYTYTFRFREIICCGTIYRGLYNEVMVDPRYIKPCKYRLAHCKLRANGSKSDSEVSDNATTKTYSDSSSDSGYDESSNQGVALDNAFKKDQVGIEEINSQIPKENN